MASSLNLSAGVSREALPLPTASPHDFQLRRRLTFDLQWMPFRFRRASSSMIVFRRGSCPEEASLPHRRRGLAALSLLADRSMLMRSRVCVQAQSAMQTDAATEATTSLCAL